MKKIDGEDRTIRELLSRRHYSIDFYQREYKWKTKQVQELINDLTDKFLDDYKDTHERSQVEKYGYYFLGSIILSQKDKTFIIDGQQRLTTLTLLLIYLHRRQSRLEQKVAIDDLIFSEKYSKRSFNIDVDERESCMNALYNGKYFDANDKSESVQNIVDRYEDIEKGFPDEIDDHALPYFIDWLIDNVYLVEITASSDNDAYTIFETMNDRGLSLTPLDMLKGYLLAKIADETTRVNATKVWKKQMEELAEFGKDEDTDSIKAWLRSQYAETIRERKKGAKPLDFDRIGTEFHRWVRDRGEYIGLYRSSDFSSFIERDLKFYTDQYLKIRQISEELTKEFETAYFNGCLRFTLHYPLLLAPLVPKDGDSTINKKIRIVSTFVDILLARRIWNSKRIGYSTMQYAIFRYIQAIRGKPIKELVKILRENLDSEEGTFDGGEILHVHQQNRFYIKQLLARITNHIEHKSGMPSRFNEYVAEGKNRYEVEHIWADHFERHTDEFSHPADFAEYRNRIGGLLLLSKSFNASYGDLPYEEKLDHYFSQNLLARSLHPNCYKRNPGFKKYIENSGLPFRPHAHFKKTDLDERQELYQKLAEEVWNPARLDREAQA